MSWQEMLLVGGCTLGTALIAQGDSWQFGKRGICYVVIGYVIKALGLFMLVTYWSTLLMWFDDALVWLWALVYMVVQIGWYRYVRRANSLSYVRKMGILVSLTLVVSIVPVLVRH